MLNEENNQALNTLKEVAMAGVVEQRRARRWGIFFKIIMLVYVFVFIGSILGATASLTKMPGSPLAADGEDYAAMVTISGVIADGEAASANNLIPALQRAFKDDRLDLEVIALIPVD